MRLNVHFFLSNYEYFTDNFCDFSAEMGERLYEELKS